MQTSFKKHRPLKFKQGFSLPEATLAVAISALGLTTLLGFVPQSLNTLQQAGGVSSESRITQHLLSSVNQADWQDDEGNDVLNSSYERNFYFDDLAIELDKEAPGPTLTYVAKVEVADADIALPDIDATTEPAEPDPYLRRVTIKIASASKESFDFTGAANYRTYASVVTRTGK